MTKVICVTADALGLCLFGRSFTNTNVEMIVGLINDALGTDLEPEFFYEIGKETLLLEDEFNKGAGFTEIDDELPEFFYEEALSPSNQVARFHAQEVNEALREWWSENAA